jgi:hypothetical protein
MLFVGRSCETEDKYKCISTGWTAFWNTLSVDALVMLLMRSLCVGMLTEYCMHGTLDNALNIFRFEYPLWLENELF